MNKYNILLSRIAGDTLIEPGLLMDDIIFTAMCIEYFDKEDLKKAYQVILNYCNENF